MNDGVVVDANIVADFVHQLLEKEGATYKLIMRILDEFGLAVDGGRLIIAEWNKTAGTELLQDWVNDQISNDKLRYVEPIRNEEVKKDLLKMRWKEGDRDFTYVWTANATETRYILTEDSDFYDPAYKRLEFKRRIAKINDEKGKVARLLKRKLNIGVGSREHIKQELMDR